MRIKMHIKMSIKMCIRIIISILIRIKMNIKICIKIRLDTALEMWYCYITRNIKIRIKTHTLKRRNGGKSMARPKLDSSIKKVKLSLTVSPDVQEMLDFIRRENDVSISEFVSDAITREYKRLRRAGRVPDEQIPGQMSMK